MVFTLIIVDYALSTSITGHNVITPYLVFIFIFLIFVFFKLWQRKSKQFNTRSAVSMAFPSPGRAFDILFEAPAFSGVKPGEDSDLDDKYRSIKAALESIANSQNLQIEIMSRTGSCLLLEPKDKLLMGNLAICLKTYLQQLYYSKPEDQDFDEIRYRKGLTGLIGAINRYVRGSEAAFHDILSSREQVYFALLGNINPDNETTSNFTFSFINNAKRVRENDTESLRTYLSDLDDNWIKKPERLVEIQDRHIIPLFTARNILRHCLSVMDSRNEQSLSEKALDILGKISERDYTGIIEAGLKYDEKDVVEQIAKEIVVSRAPILNDQLAPKFAFQF